MRFTILGFDQQKAMDLGLSMDALMLLRWFIDFKDSGSIVRKYVKSIDAFYYWVTYRKIISDIPLIVADCKVKNEQGKDYKSSEEERLFHSQKQKIKRILDGNLSKVLIKHVEKDSTGTYLYVSLNEEIYGDLISGNDNKLGDYLKDSVKESETSSNIGGKNDTGILNQTNDEVGEGIRTKGDTETIGREHDGVSGGSIKNNTTKINQLNNSSIKNNKDIYCSVINYLNEKAKTKYKIYSKKTQRLILSRITEGFTEEDFVKVIDNKCEDWLGTDYEQYLRPETLFGTKFESYLNQKVRKGTTYGGVKQNFESGEVSAFDFSNINDF